MSLHRVRGLIFIHLKTITCIPTKAVNIFMDLKNKARLAKVKHSTVFLCKLEKVWKDLILKDQTEILWAQFLEMKKPIKSYKTITTKESTVNLLDLSVFATDFFKINTFNKHLQLFLWNKSYNMRITNTTSINL